MLPTPNASLSFSVCEKGEVVRPPEMGLNNAKCKTLTAARKKNANYKTTALKIMQ